MKFEPVTIKDIAIKLNLSTSTVSRALRGSYEISDETKKIVLEYAEKINYRPNPIALSLKERRSHSIGIVVPEIANSFFSQAINGIESIAYNSGYHVSISQSHESFERELINVQHMASRSIDGLLISISAETSDFSHLKELHERGLPIVFFDRIVDEIDTFKVVCDNFKGAYDATKHLIKQGYKRIAHITSSSHLFITRKRLEGYKKALEDHKIPYDEALVKHCNHGGMVVEEVEEAVTTLFSVKNKPDAILSAGDRITTVILSVIKKHKKINKDLAYIGFSNSDLTDMFSPSLSVVRQPAFEMGKTAIELLIKLIESKRPITEFETKVMESKIIIKESSDHRKKG
jgi:LacI family transcriptional regulator